MCSTRNHPLPWVALHTKYSEKDSRPIHSSQRSCSASYLAQRRRGTGYTDLQVRLSVATCSMRMVMVMTVTVMVVTVAGTAEKQVAMECLAEIPDC